MKAVILAGGKGKRLAPYTTVLPKPLMPIGDMPILEVVLRQLKRHGCQEVTMAVGHLAELLMAFFNDGTKLGMKINYSIEDKPLGTAGPLALVRGLEDHFFVMNGDILTDLDFSDLYRHHCESGALATIATYQRTVRIDFGVLETDADHFVREYIEKPTMGYQVSMGIYVFDPAVLAYIKPDTFFDFPDLVKLLISLDKKVATYPFSGYWLDIGRPDDYEKATEEFEHHKQMFLPEVAL
jgi:NDP-mannose synthase